MIFTLAIGSSLLEIFILDMHGGRNICYRLWQALLEIPFHSRNCDQDLVKLYEQLTSTADL